MGSLSYFFKNGMQARSMHSVLIINYMKSGEAMNLQIQSCERYLYQIFVGQL